ATESVFVPLAEALGLDLTTPERFLDAVSEGTEPTAADKAAVDRQIQDRKVNVLVYNTQNATPDVRSLVSDARAARIPVTKVTETLVPAYSSFQSWQVRQLRSLERALSTAAPT